MSKLHVTGALFLVLWSLAAAAGPKLVEEPQFDYQAQKDNADLIQMSTVIQPVAKLSMVQGYADPYQLHKSTEGIRNFVMARSTFTLKLGLDEIKKRTENPMDLSKYSQKFKVNSCRGHECDGFIVTSIAKNNVTFVSGVMDQQSAGWENTFKSLNNPDLIVAQRFTKIEFAFESGSNFAAFYKVNDSETWVQSFQFFMIRDSAYRIPFINLDKKIREIIKHMLVDGRGAILQENGVQRMIQSVRGPAARL
ncbi:MAG: hypothetical protein H7326_00700 [Bdellovibrionaceae bacterium]|nr:hypothetical protein [Pseudobdellovibrionaceae bacterium]